MKTILGFAAPKALQTPKLFFLRQPTAALKKTISIMRIAGCFTATLQNWFFEAIAV